MPCQGFLVKAGKITLIAFMWFFSAVGSHMLCQTCFRNWCIATLVTFVNLFPMSLQMSSQIACQWKWKTTCFAFVWLFSTVTFKVIHQMMFIRCCIITLVAFVWFVALFLFVQCSCMPSNGVGVSGSKVAVLAFVRLLSTVCSYVRLQTWCIYRGIIAFVALIWLFSAMYFQMSSQWFNMTGFKVTLAAFVWLFSSVFFAIFCQSHGILNWKRQDGMVTV